jgi:SAM-dependent methyltransferase
MHLNHSFLIAFAKSHAPNGATLDYGCGAGEVVRGGLAENLDIYGCETFYEGGNGYRGAIADLLGSRILPMVGGCIPFPDSFFDCIVSNMVFEHVEDIDLALAEIKRVLKPNGVVLSIFPSVEVIREGHCGVPFAHRLSKHRRLGYYWLLAFRLLGCGYFTDGRTRRAWAKNFQNWLNSYCFYRPKREIDQAFVRNGFKACRAENLYIKFRKLPLNPFLLRHFATMVITASKIETPHYETSSISNC